MARFLGIDIGHTALRGVLVHSALRKVEVERYVEIPLTEAPGSPGRLPELLEAGRNLRTAIGGVSVQVVASVDGEHTSLRVLELPAAAKKRVAEVLPFELEAVLPYDPHEAIIDYQIIESTKDTLQVLAASVLHRHVDACLQELRHAGLDPRELAGGAAALDGATALVPELRAPGPILLLDFGDHRMDLCMLRDGHCAMARTIGFGIQDMPAAGDAAAQELQRTLAAFRSAGHPALETVYFSGAGSLAVGVIAWLSQAVGHDVKPLLLPAPTIAQTPASPVFGKAAALAARAVTPGHRIDLRKGEFVPAEGRSNCSTTRAWWRAARSQ